MWDIEQYKDKLPITLDIIEPPCKFCLHFSPRIVTNSRGDFDGIVCCLNGNGQCGDFSCFKLDESKKVNYLSSIFLTMKLTDKDEEYLSTLIEETLEKSKLGLFIALETYLGK